MVAPFVSASATLVLHTFLATRAFAVSTNITVDDTNSTVWNFVGGWSAVTPSTPCPGCFAQPDPSQVFNSSWHDGSVVSGSVTFQGSAVYIYGIDMTATSGTNISFNMNNPSTAGFHYFGATGTTYNVPFFSATKLDPSVQHTVSFIGQTSLTGAGAMLFDYAVITVDEQAAASLSSSATLSTSSTSPSPSSTATPAPTRKSKTGAIVGAVLAVVLGMALLGGIFLFLRRRSRRRAAFAQSNIDIDPGYDGAVAGRRFSRSSAGLIVEPYQPMSVDSLRGPSFRAEAVSVSGVSTAATPSASSPPATETTRSDSKTPPAPVVLAWDPNAARARESDMEERLRHLEALVRPPEYNTN
ncbi:hypothetical protein DFH06DRAFT_1197118 [Mycena polygramma]|nr:hypothetical protein DFH06DRAFT_1197118 [Mycena polygramma]